MVASGPTHARIIKEEWKPLSNDYISHLLIFNAPITDADVQDLKTYLGKNGIQVNNVTRIGCCMVEISGNLYDVNKVFLSLHELSLSKYPKGTYVWFEPQEIW